MNTRLVAMLVIWFVCSSVSIYYTSVVLLQESAKATHEVLLRYEDGEQYQHELSRSARAELLEEKLSAEEYIYFKDEYNRAVDEKIRSIMGGVFLVVATVAGIPMVYFNLPSKKQEASA